MVTDEIPETELNGGIFFPFPFFEKPFHEELKKNGNMKYLWPQKVKGSWEVTVTYFMTSKVTLIFMVFLT